MSATARVIFALGIIEAVMLLFVAGYCLFVLAARPLARRYLSFLFGANRPSRSDNGRAGLNAPLAPRVHIVRRGGLDQ